MDAEERRKKITPSEKQVNLSEESIRLGSKFGIPNKTDMAEIRKDPEFVAAQESMKPKSTLEKTQQFLATSPAAKVMTPNKSKFVKSVTMNPPTGENPNMISFDLGNPEKRSQFIMSDPMAVSMGEMAADGSLANESLGKIFNMALDDVDENRKARKAGQKYRGLFRPVDEQ